MTDLHLSAVREAEKATRKMDLLTTDLRTYVDSQVQVHWEKRETGMEDLRVTIASLARVVEDSIGTIARDIGSASGRLGDLERAQEQLRVQSNASLNALQQSLGYKQESVSRAIQSLARQINVTNPLLTY